MHINKIFELDSSGVVMNKIHFIAKVFCTNSTIYYMGAFF